MLNTLSINLKTDIKTDRPTSLPITLMSQDVNNNQFILRFTNGGESVTLDDSYTVEVLTKFTKSGTSRLTSATVRQDYATWEFDTAYITQDEDVRNYVYVRKSGSLVVSADANCFVFSVDLSEIDKGAGKVAETYDENYQKHLDEFKENVNFEEIAQAEQARKEAELLREENYEQKVDTAIVEADVVEKVDNKVTELTPQISNLTAQLAQTSTYANPKLTNINEMNSNQPVVTFIDDDGQNEVYTRLLPIFTSKQVPFGGAIISGYAKNQLDGFMDLQQINECRQGGMEALCHTVNHYNLATIPQSDVDYELRESKKWLIENGLENEAHVYPQSGQNLFIRKTTRLYYDYAFGDNGFNDQGYLDHSRIKRIGFGSWTGGNPSIDGISEKDTLEYYKACVDHAVATNSWLVFMIHVKQQSLEQDGYLSELIDYIKSLNVKILKPSDAFRLKANKFTVGDLSEKHLFIGEKEVATNITSYLRDTLKGRTASSPVTSFLKNYVTVIDVTNADNASFPDGAGTLEVYRTNFGWEGYSFQLYRPLSNNKTYRRTWNATTNKWNDFVWVEGEVNPIKNLITNSVNATTPDSHFEANKISYCSIQTANASGFPRNSGGALVVDKTIALNGYIKHRYHVYNSNEIWGRLVKPDGTYGEWVCLNPYNRLTINIPEVIVPANSTAEVRVDFSGLNASTSHIWGNPAWGLSSGVFYNVMVSENGKVTVRFANVTGASLTITTRNWHFSYVL